MKKTLSILLSLVMIISVTSGMDITVYADEFDDKVKETDVLFQQIVDATPKILELDISEIEYALNYNEISSSIENLIINSWEKAKIDMDKVDELFNQYFISTYPLYYGNKDSFRALNICFYKRYVDNNSDLEIHVGLEFNNTKNYNKIDENICRNLEIKDSQIIEADFDYLNSDDFFNECHKIVSEFYTKSVNDNTIEIVFDSGMGFSHHLNTILSGHGGGPYIGIFKNGILYEIREVCPKKIVPAIIVPYTVLDEDITDYALNLIKSTYSNKEFIQNIIGIKEGFENEGEEITEYPNGYTVYYGDQGKDWISIKKELSHSWDNGRVKKEATCTTTGVKTFTCTVCGDSYTETIYAIGHTPVKDNAVEPTCTTTGLTEGSYCSACGETIVAQETINATGHIFCNNSPTCIVCGIANPNYVAPQPSTPTEPTNPTVPIQPSQPNTPATPAQSAPIQPSVPTPTVAKEKAPVGAKKVNGEWIAKKQKNAKIKKLTKAKKSFKASWKKVNGVKGYQIQYSTSKKFTKKTTKSVTIKKNKTTSKTVKKLKAKKKYYVRIRTYKNVKLNGKTVKVYSSWSKAKTVKTK